MEMGTQPYALAKKEGRVVWFLGTLVIVKATGEQTGGAFDNVMPAGFASPYHVHRNEDESFYVAEGEMAFYVGNERVEAGPGAFVYGPRGVPPRVRGGGNGAGQDTPAKLPGGLRGVPRGGGRAGRGAGPAAGGAARHGEADGDRRQVRHRDLGAAARPLGMAIAPRVSVARGKECRGVGRREQGRHPTVDRQPTPPESRSRILGVVDRQDPVVLPPGDERRHRQAGEIVQHHYALARRPELGGRRRRPLSGAPPRPSPRRSRPPRRPRPSAASPWPCPAGRSR
jgi:quercetin dioxygenase-like cupin family protein